MSLSLVTAANLAIQCDGYLVFTSRSLKSHSWIWSSYLWAVGLVGWSRRNWFQKTLETSKSLSVCDLCSCESFSCGAFASDLTLTCLWGHLGTSHSYSRLSFVWQTFYFWYQFMIYDFGLCLRFLSWFIVEACLHLFLTSSESCHRLCFYPRSLWVSR